MTDIDHITRRLSDLETVVKEQGYRIKALEKAASPTYAPSSVSASLCQKCAAVIPNNGAFTCQHSPCWMKPEVRRAPDCPSHKTDPLGR